MLALLAVSFGANAQELSFGPRVGMNVAHITKADGLNSKMGFTVGGYVEYKFTDVWAAEGALMYSLQGGRHKESGTNDGVNYKYKTKVNLNYLNIPLLAKAYVWQGLNVFAGPQMGFLVGSKLKEKYKEDGSTEEKTNVGIGSLMHKFDLSLMLGAGYQFNCGANVSANYNIGLTNMYKNSGDGPKVKSKNGVFQINVGYRF